MVAGGAVTASTRLRNSSPSVCCAAQLISCARLTNCRALSARPSSNRCRSSDSAHGWRCGGTQGGSGARFCGADRSFEHDGAGEHVAHPFLPRAAADDHHAGDRGQRKHQARLLEDEPRQPAHQRVPEADRSAVVADHAQAHGQLAEGPAAAEPLEDDRVAGQHEHDLGDQQAWKRRRLRRRRARRRAAPAGTAEPSAQSDVERRGHDPGADAGRRPDASRTPSPETRAGPLGSMTRTLRSNRVLTRPGGHALSLIALVLASVVAFRARRAEYSGRGPGQLRRAAPPEWDRLAELSGRRRLSGAEADELVALYRQVATHLSLVQTRAPDPQLIARLSRLLARGRAAAVGTSRVRGWSALARGVLVDFPVTLYRTWRWSVGVAVASLGSDRGDDAVAARAPGAGAPGVARQRGAPARRARLPRLLLRASGAVVRRARVDQQRAGRGAGDVPRRSR